MNIYPLYSSSKGNLFLLESNDTNILIDVGVSYKNVCLALEGIDKSISDIDAILITHEHTDHIKGLSLISKKHNIPIYTSIKTKEYLKENLNIQNDINGFNYNDTFVINDLNITLFETSHDAVMPAGFYISDNIKSLAFATDLGYVSDDILNYLMKADYIVLESNYDKIMLDYGKYPYNTKKRIDSDIGHLSNSCTASTINCIMQIDKNKRFLLSHLSENNNTPNVAAETIYNHLSVNGIDDHNICFATQNLSFERYTI